MTTTIELPDRQAQQLLTVLQKNETAIGPLDAVRWTESDADNIGVIREDIEQQVESQ